MRKRKYTNEEFILAVKNNVSVAAALDQLGLKPAGGNYKIFRQTVSNLQLDTSHFTGQGHLKGKSHTWSKSASLEELLSYGSSVQSFKLKNKLLKAGLFKPICSSCNLDTWLGKPIALELDHRDGDHLNNQLANLRLLCPNCHSMTETYRGKNKKKS